ncbi:MAG: endonuclease/exonuclease/phosphatase family protein [Geminicoccaceae bacterium]|nr:endonuclease/exonuclease/phosphatase family protein [Geminicoccaceae bacterium]
MKIVLLVCAVLLVGATALSVVRSGRWWIRGCDFPRMQIAVLLAVLLPVHLALYGVSSWLDGLVAGALLASLAYQLWRIVPYTPLHRPQVARATATGGGRSIRFMVANVLMTNRRADDLLALVREADPDLLLTVETDGWWDRRLSVLDRDYPWSVKHPLDNTYGLHLFSRLELVDPQLRFLMRDDTPSVQTRVRLASGDLIDFWGLHPRPPSPGQDTEKRDAEILLVGEEVKVAARPAIVAGDLNDTAWSHTSRLFQRISHTLDPRIGRGMYATFHARWPIFRWPLDHVFHDASFTLVHLERLAYFGSDHFPVLAELRYAPHAESRQSEPPDADEEEENEARARIDEGKRAD